MRGRGRQPPHSRLLEPGQIYGRQLCSRTFPMRPGLFFCLAALAGCASLVVSLPDQSDSDDDKDWAIDILTTEGQKGWLEKVLKTAPKVKTEGKTGDHEHWRNSSHAADKRSRTSLFEGAFKKFKKAVTSSLASRGSVVKKELKKIEHEWDELDEDAQEAFQEVFDVTAENLEAFTKAKEEPDDAMAAATAIGAAVFGLMGYGAPMVAKPPLFLMAVILNSFGNDEDMEEMIKDQLEAMYQTEMKGKAIGLIVKFQRSQTFLSSYLEGESPHTKDDLDFLTKQIQILDGVEFMGTLFLEIEGMFQKNENDDGETFFQYLELYTRLTVLKNLILQQTVALLPPSMKVARGAVIKQIKVMHESYKTELEKFFEPDIESKILPWFDPNDYPVTHAFLRSVFENFVADRPLSGLYHILPLSKDRHKFNAVSLGWVPARVFYNYQSNLPQAQPNAERNQWRLVSFGNNLFTIKSRYGCPDNSRCNAFLGLERKFRKITLGMRNFVVLRDSEPTFWEIVVVSPSMYRIRSKVDCPGGKKCDRMLRYSLFHIRGFWIVEAENWRRGGDFLWKLEKITQPEKPEEEN